MSTSVVLLAYKEAENLKILLPQIHKVMEKLKDDYEVIVIDSAKPLDNTKEVCEKNNTLYYPQEEPGYAGAFRTGIKYVTKKRMLVLDADGSHNPKNIADISRMFDRGGYDIVIGSRYTKGGVSNERLPISCQRFSIRPCVFVWESGQKTFPQVTGCMMQSRSKR